ncbi:zinc metalloprotease [Elizabethkingia miricola]|nr:hypothetical protein [Elizabethkingia miricola]PSL88161.1 hypothetical protein C7V10_11255 [Elizabethkingia miricola]QHQ87627.1 hypothetical protein FE632_12875 [Elizabethkingia miricola]UIO95124.1 hypothetical protein LYZ41_13070 [Elizabethkingia miricola]WER11922.1 hypothetical protein P0M31_12845 [Elizabethkingia miricola]WGL72096.1 hypothetical protein QFB80_12800 [Elizabethkingia miricola]
MKAEDVLKISADIEISKFTDKEYLLINSKQNSYVKINEHSFYVLSLIDGKRTLNDIRNEYNLLPFNDISLKQLSALLEKFIEYSVFSGSTTVKKVKIPNYIKFGFIILKPSVISKITPFLEIFFRKKIYVIVLLIGLLMFLHTLYKNIESPIHLNIFSILPYFFTIMAFSVFFHEFGHATAAYHFGAKHGGIGGGFYLYYMPILYANVTDVWRLKRYERIIVNCAGVYFELIFYIFLSLIGLLLNNFTIQFLAFFILFKSLYNLIPFLRADGYWILSDLFNKPNLSSHAFNNLKIIFWSLFKFRLPKFKMDNYLLAFYGLINASLIIMFYYYNLFYQYKIILNFPIIVFNGIGELFKNADFRIEVRYFFKYFSVLIFYFITIRIIIYAIRKVIKKKNYK